MISRTLYTYSNVQINGSGLLVQSFNLNTSSAHEQIDEYGNENFYQVIGEPVMATCEINCYPEAGFGNLIAQLTSHTKSSDPVRESIRSNFGGLDHALLSSLKLDASQGAVPMASLNFMGAVSVAANLSDSSSAAAITTIYSTESISINDSDVCAQKISMDWAIPVSAIPKYTESLSYPTGFFGEPVGVTTVNAQGITSFVSPITSIDFGGIRADFTDIKVISSGVSQAVGTVAATFNVSFQCSSNNVTFS